MSFLKIKNLSVDYPMRKETVYAAKDINIEVNKGEILGLVGGLILFSYGIIMTFQPENFGKVYAAYGGFFVVSSLLWGYWIDKKKPDKFEIIGSIVVLIGVAVMFYFPR